MVKNLSFPTWQDHMAKPRWVKVLCAEIVWHWKSFWVIFTLSHFGSLDLLDIVIEQISEMAIYGDVSWLYMYIYIKIEKNIRKNLSVVISLVWWVQPSFRRKKKKNGGRKVAKQRQPRFAAVNFGPCYEKNNAKLLPCELHISVPRRWKLHSSFIRCSLPRCMSAGFSWMILRFLSDCFLKGRSWHNKWSRPWKYTRVFTVRHWKHTRSFCSTWMFPKIVGFPPKSSIKKIGFSFINTIHFGGVSPYFWFNTPYLVPSKGSFYLVWFGGFMPVGAWWWMVGFNHNRRPEKWVAREDPFLLSQARPIFQELSQFVSGRI